MNNTLAIIPARAGSKGLPAKNIKMFCGKPLIWYSIYAAQKSNCFKKIVVSTDCQQIATVSRSYKVQVIDRPTDLARDDSKVIDTIKHSLLKLKLDENFDPDIVVNLNPTSPLRNYLDIQRVLKLLNKGFNDSIITGRLLRVSEYGQWVIDADNSIKSLYDTTSLKNRQELQLQNRLIENGSIYAIKKDVLCERNSLIGANPGYIAMTSEQSIDINVLDDFLLAEMYMKNLFIDYFENKI